MTDFHATAKAIRDIRLTVWDLDGCYALDRLYDAAQNIGRALEYAQPDAERAAKLDKHLRKMAIEISCQFGTEPPTPREIEVMDMDARNKALREDA